MTTDIVIFAIIAAIVLYRLYLTLGDRSGFDPSDKLDKNNVYGNDDSQTTSSNRSETSSKNNFESFDAFIRPPLIAIAKLDPTFDINEFIQGATTAYEMTLEAYAKENLSDLKSLLSTELFEIFKKSIEARQSQGESYENTLIKLDDALIVDAKLNGTIARLSVKFVSEQVPILKDKEGVILEGNPDQIDQVIDHWVFERSLKSSNPNWVVIETDD